MCMSRKLLAVTLAPLFEVGRCIYHCFLLIGSCYADTSAGPARRPLFRNVKRARSIISMTAVSALSASRQSPFNSRLGVVQLSALCLLVPSISSAARIGFVPQWRRGKPGLPRARYSWIDSGCPASGSMQRRAPCHFPDNGQVQSPAVIASTTTVARSKKCKVRFPEYLAPHGRTGHTSRRPIK